MSFESLLNHYATRQAKLIASIAAAKPILMQALKDAGIAQVTVEYDGIGDSGQIDEVTAVEISGSEIDITGSQRIDVRLGDKVVTHDSLAAFVEGFCWDLIGLHHDGFENNDGGFGKFTLTVATGSVSLERNDRYVAVNHSALEV